MSSRKPPYGWNTRRQSRRISASQCPPFPWTTRIGSPRGLVNIMLGEGMSSRLFLEIREKLGLAYDVHSSLSQYLDCGSLVVYCGSDPSRSQKSLAAIMGQLSAMREGFSHLELEKAREYSRGASCCEWKTPAAWPCGRAVRSYC